MLRIALNGKNLTYWGLLTGIEKRPKDLSKPESDTNGDVFEEDASVPVPGNAPSGSHRPAVPNPTRAQLTARAKKQAEWDQRNAIVLMYMASTVDITMLVYFRGGKTAAQIYEDLRELCEAKSLYAVSNKAIQWATWKYKTGVKPEDFVTKWLHLFVEMQEAYPVSERVSSLHAIHVFLHAVASNPACQHWLNTVSIHENWSYDRNLRNIYGDFIASEGRRIGNDRTYQLQQASSNVASTRKKGFNKGKGKDKSASKDSDSSPYHCPFHDRMTSHRPRDCFLNPKNKKKNKKGKPESANNASANAYQF